MRRLPQSTNGGGLDDHVRAIVREEWAKIRAEIVDELVPHTAWPLHRPVRHATSIDGAHKVGRLWYARRSAIESYIESHQRAAVKRAAPAPVPEPAPDADDFDLWIRGRASR